MFRIPVGRHLFTLAFLRNETQRRDSEEIFALQSQRRQSDGISQPSPSPVDLSERYPRESPLVDLPNAQSAKIDDQVDRPSLPRLSRYDSTATSPQLLDHSAHLRRRRRFVSLSLQLDDEQTFSSVLLATSLLQEVFRQGYEGKIRIEKSSPIEQVKTTVSPPAPPLISSVERKGKPSFSTRLRDLPSPSKSREQQLSSRLTSSSSSSPRTTPSTNDKTSTDFYFSKSFAFEDLCFLLGPGKYLVDRRYEEQIYPYLASGFCRVENDEQGRNIEEHLDSILPKSLSVEPVAIEQHLRLFVDSPTIEQFLSEYYSNSSVIITNAKAIQRERASLSN